eukprot:gb/GECH01012586.1/.p1 GENE.gb/GECH01012586.1/~~gb/GECH01012586.1/.p1  ORF type:complete len:562 (+),score=81.98 gb/GECH01012586.1/:1-1686(+)
MFKHFFCTLKHIIFYITMTQVKVHIDTPRWMESSNQEEMMSQLDKWLTSKEHDDEKVPNDKEGSGKIQYLNKAPEKLNNDKQSNEKSIDYNGSSSEIGYNKDKNTEFQQIFSSSFSAIDEVNNTLDAVFSQDFINDTEQLRLIALEKSLKYAALRIENNVDHKDDCGVQVDLDRSHLEEMEKQIKTLRQENARLHAAVDRHRERSSKLQQEHSATIRDLEFLQKQLTQQAKYSYDPGRSSNLKDASTGTNQVEKDELDKLIQTSVRMNHKNKTLTGQMNAIAQYGDRDKELRRKKIILDLRHMVHGIRAVRIRKSAEEDDEYELRQERMVSNIVQRMETRWAKQKQRWEKKREEIEQKRQENMENCLRHCYRIVWGIHSHQRQLRDPGPRTPNRSSRCSSSTRHSDGSGSTHNSASVSYEPRQTGSTSISKSKLKRAKDPSLTPTLHLSRDSRPSREQPLAKGVPYRKGWFVGGGFKACMVDGNDNTPKTSRTRPQSTIQPDFEKFRPHSARPWLSNSPKDVDAVVEPLSISCISHRHSLRTRGAGKNKSPRSRKKKRGKL